MRSSQPKLLYLISTLETGGAQVGMIRLLNGLNQDEFDVTVIALRTSNQDLIGQLPEDCAFRSLDMDSKRDIRKLRPLWNELEDTDVLVCSLYHSTVLGRILGSLRFTPVIANWNHNQQFKSVLRRFSYLLTTPMSDVILADSESVTDRIISEIGMLRHLTSVSTVPIAGVDVQRFQPSDAPAEKPMTIGTIGRLCEEKNHQQVLDTATAMREDEVEFRIAGDGPKRSELESVVVDRDLENVSFLGEIDVDAVPSFLNDTDIYFQPSKTEGLCITVIEAMAAGKPVVASSVGGISESVIHGQTGFLANPEETDRFQKYLVELASDEQKREKFGQAGRSRVENRYSKQTLVNQFKDAISD